MSMTKSGLENDVITINVTNWKMLKWLFVQQVLISYFLIKKGHVYKSNYGNSE